MEIGFLTAFLGGTLALLSPCSALLLPAFFASTVGARLRLLVHAGVFYLGVLLTLVPFGLGLGALGSLLLSERRLLIAFTSVVLVGLGSAQIFGFGFDVSRLLPDRLHRGASTGTGMLRTLLLGAVSGVAGFCAGPILGAILTLAMAQANPWASGTLLAVYGAGMVLPLVVIAAVWHRMGARGRRLLRGRSFRFRGREFHSVPVVTGALIAVVGVAFWLTNGFVGLPALIPTDVQTWLQQRSGLLSGPVVDVIAILAGVAVGVWAWTRRRTARRASTEHITKQSASPEIAP